jgi:hypothetical protein
MSEIKSRKHKNVPKKISHRYGKTRRETLGSKMGKHATGGKKAPATTIALLVL